MKNKHFKCSVASMLDTYRTPTFARHLSIYIVYIETMVEFKNLKTYVSASYPLSKSHIDCMSGSYSLSKVIKITC